MEKNTKKSFVLYHDIREPLKLLTDAERGKLFLIILDYSEYGIVPELTGAMQMAFAFIKTALDRDNAAWEDKRQKRKEAGHKGGKQKAENQANQANANFAKQNEQKETNQAVNVIVPVNTLPKERVFTGLEENQFNNNPPAAGGAYHAPAQAIKKPLEELTKEERAALLPTLI